MLRHPVSVPTKSDFSTVELGGVFMVGSESENSGIALPLFVWRHRKTEGTVTPIALAFHDANVTQTIEPSRETNGDKAWYACDEFGAETSVDQSTRPLVVLMARTRRLSSAIIAISEFGIKAGVDPTHSSPLEMHAELIGTAVRLPFVAMKVCW